MSGPTGGGWSMDPSALGELRLQQARAALERGDAALAVVEAEELLDALPDHAEALLLVGDASLDLNDAHAAFAAYARHDELAPDNPMALSGLAIAAFEMTQLETCVEAAARAVALDPKLAEAWYFLGMARERLGQSQEAGLAFFKAQQLDPGTYPLVPPLPDLVWSAAFDEAMTLLPAKLADWYARVHVDVADLPTLDELRAAEPPLPPTASALYVGDPPEPGEGWKQPPERVRLYRGNLQRMAVMEGDLALRIAEALRHEALDWLGLEPDALPLIGRAAGA